MRTTQMMGGVERERGQEWGKDASSTNTTRRASISLPFFFVYPPLFLQNFDIHARVWEMSGLCNPSILFVRTGTYVYVCIYNFFFFSISILS